MRRWVTLAAVLVAMVTVHPLTFVFACALVAVYALLDAAFEPRRGLLRLAALVLVMAPPAAIGFAVQAASVPFGVALESQSQLERITTPVQVGPFAVREPNPAVTADGLVAWEREGTDATTFFLHQKLAIGEEHRYLVLGPRTVLVHPQVWLVPPFAVGIVGGVLIAVLAPRGRLRTYLIASVALVLSLALVPAAAQLLGRVATPWLLWRVVWLVPIPLVMAAGALRLWRSRSIAGGLVVLALLVALASTFSARAWTGTDPFRLMEVAEALDAERGVLVAPVDVAQMVSMRATALKPVGYRGAIFIANNYPTDRLEEGRQRLFDNFLFYDSDVPASRRRETLDRQGVTHVVVAEEDEPQLDLDVLPLRLDRPLPQGYRLYRVTPD